ncbi:MAG: NAD(P)/FAD-dependent oxidoreductase [Pyrinomonadaceae bacterium]
MAYEVVVVGGGIGGLTSAALLAARGVSVCVLERESRVGGCAAAFEKFGYTFETGAGLYAGWQRGEIHERIFSELQAQAPEVRSVSPPYIVRLPDGTDVAIAKETEEFFENLRAAFPECADAAINFYIELAPIAEALKRTIERVPDLRTASKMRRVRAAATEARTASRVFSQMDHTVAQHLEKTSQRFRRFIDAQLQIFAQRASDTCAYLYGAVALMIPRWGMHAMRGGAQSLADALAESIKRSGGVVRLNAPALRLAYDSAGRAVGVDLLSGETVEAERAIISNLTVWDTYGKLVGTGRTPDDVRKRLKNLQGWGAYLLFLGMDEEAARRLPASHVLALTGWQEEQAYDAENAQFMFACAPEWDARAPSGKRAVTVCAFTEATQWFSFHEDETEHEAQDQSTLEMCWERMHRMMPELVDDVEVIETMTPRSFYENTRRRLGMVGGVGQSLDLFGMNSFSHQTALPNLYMVGDTTFPGQGIVAVTHSALIVANEIAPR